jgi:hypothetical protein
MNRTVIFAAALGVAAVPATAQTSSSQQSSQQDVVGTILGSLFGTRPGTTTSLEAEWAAGRTPLGNQRVEFENRVDAAVQAGTLTQATGTRLRSDYGSLVQLETRYGADRRFTTAERNELADRYGELTQVLADGRYADSATAATAAVADGQAEFGRRVDAQVTARKLSRTNGTRLKSDYAALVQVETGYLRDGVLSAAEQDDLDARLDALDARVGDTSYAAAPPTPRARLDAIAGALPASGLTAAAQTQLRIELEDLTRLESAYSRLTTSADEQAYLDRRLTDLETRARVRR